jgi:ethanolamine utilization protein EutA (predicted chaperonin)
VSKNTSSSDACCVQAVCFKQEPQRRKHLPCSVRRFAFSDYNVQLQTTECQVIFRVLIALHRSSSNRYRMTRIFFTQVSYDCNILFTRVSYDCNILFTQVLYDCNILFTQVSYDCNIFFTQILYDCSIFHSYYQNVNLIINFLFKILLSFVS